MLSRLVSGGVTERLTLALIWSMFNATLAT